MKWLTMWLTLYVLMTLWKKIFRNYKFAANADIFEKIADMMNQIAASNDWMYKASFSQAWIKLGLVSGCKSVSLTQRTANGQSRYQFQKGNRTT